MSTVATSPAPASTADLRVHRVEVRPRPEMGDPKAASLRHDAAAIGLAPSDVETARIYLIEGRLSPAQLQRISAELLADPVTERSTVGVVPPSNPRTTRTIEVHPLPGVMDPVAQSVRDAIRELTGLEVQVSTGWRYDLSPLTLDAADLLARRLLANPVVHAIHHTPHHPPALPRGHSYTLTIRQVPLRTLDDPALERLSREAHLFLDLAEMRAIRDHYKTLDRDPTEIELETLAQTWSEHCVHKTLKSTIRYRAAGQHADPIRWTNRPGHTVNTDGSITIANLLKSTVAAATHELIQEGVDWCLSVFVDNAGIIAFDDNHAVCVKVETHNHPSAIEPYGGSATGIGGCIRDILGTGLGAKPIASTDVFCVAYPGDWTDKGAAGTSPGSTTGSPLPSGCLHPRRVLTDVVAGVRDYGNRMGIPTVSGAVWFDNRHIGNPLVFCGCIGLMPRTAIGGRARPGDRIIALGGRTGRDGIHGATFSSAELTDTHADEFAHAVQIGNAIEEKRVLDVILRARDGDGAEESTMWPDDQPNPGALPEGRVSIATPAPRRSRSLFSAITDCGAGGFSSAVGEMAADLGATVHLERAPLKYDGLSPTEIWISEAQERMVLAVPPASIPALARICREEGVEMADLGEFGTPGHDLVLMYHATEVGRLSMHFLHDGIPTPTREAEWAAEAAPSEALGSPGPAPSLRSSTAASLLALLSHPNIASKHWIISQYDHEVQGRTVIKPLVGPGRGPSDAAVIEPVPGTGKGLAISQGLSTGYMADAAGGDPYLMTLAAIDECVRNLVCVGADPARIAILDNFCWPSCRKPRNLGSLVRAAEACYDGAKAYRTPFVSGKDSLNNQFTTDDGRTIEIPPTLLITGIGIVPTLDRVATMDAKRAGNLLLMVGATQTALAGSHIAQLGAASGSSTAAFPRTDLTLGPRLARAVHNLIVAGHVASAHDISDGGLLCAVAEMLIAAGPELGADLLGPESPTDPLCWAFGESPSRYIIEIEPRHIEAVRTLLDGLPCEVIGEVTSTSRLVWTGAGLDLPVPDLHAAWTRTLDW